MKCILTGIKKIPVLLVLLVNCMEPVSFNSLQGAFRGQIPCADCPGINVYLTLRADSVYNLQWQYLERKVEVKDSGIWNIIKTNKKYIIVLKSNQSHHKTYYLIEDINTIEMLGNNKNRIDNGLNYTLHRVRNSIRTRRR